MATQQSSTKAATSLRLTRTFAARREKVFQAWIDPKALTQWFAPSDQFEIKIPQLDLKPGGRYRVEMKSPDGKLHTVIGVYREIRAPERLVFTWRWESEPGQSEDTLVTLELRGRGDSTELVLTHERFLSEGARDEHKKGWDGCLDRLTKYVVS